MIDIEQQLREAALDLPADAPSVTERAAEEGLLDVAYSSVDSPLGPLVVAATPKGLVRVSYTEFRGEDVRSRRAGHIPGARLRAFEDLIAPDGTFRPVDEMLAILRDSGVEPAEVRATYCQTGARSALGWFVLSELAGYRNVRNYAGSWEEWGNREDTPIERD